jgi:Lysophospholipase
MTDIGNQAAPWMDIEEFTLAARGMVFSGLACGPKEGETVLLLHGFPQFADSWAEVAVALAKAGYRAIAIDQRGYSAGARPETVRDYAVDDLVADVLAIAIALGLERFHLAGHDWGGIVAWTALLQKSRRCLIEGGYF